LLGLVDLERERSNAIGRPFVPASAFTRRDLICSSSAWIWFTKSGRE